MVRGIARVIRLLRILLLRKIRSPFWLMLKTSSPMIRYKLNIIHNPLKPPLLSTIPCPTYMQITSPLATGHETRAPSTLHRGSHDEQPSNAINRGHPGLASKAAAAVSTNTTQYHKNHACEYYHPVDPRVASRDVNGLSTVVYPSLGIRETPTDVSRSLQS